MWIFGYGSLIWRPGFAYRHRTTGYVRGWSRRFYQGSPDHRGTPAAPGRVVTLLSESEATCWGAAYRVSEAIYDEILAALDVREKAGYERVEVRVIPETSESSDGEGEGIVHATCWIAGPGNADFLGPDAVDAMARHIVRSRGPSGRNVDYLFELTRSLREMGAHDPHVFELEAAARRILAAR